LQESETASTHQQVSDTLPLSEFLKPELTEPAPVWQGETSKASWRGKLIIIEMIMNIAGFSLSNWVTYGFS
jgi:hypothetical protein